MSKKLNKDAFLIKILLDKGASYADVCSILGISKSKVIYWAGHDIPTSKNNWRRKLPEEYFQKILSLAKNETTSTMSGRKICSIINRELEENHIVDKNNKPVMIHKSSVCRYLKDFYGKPKRIRKVFYLSPEQIQKREEFCNMILDRKINFDQIMFTDECIINLNSYTRDWIRLDSEAQEQLRNGDKEVYKLINRQTKKYEKSLMIAGGISYYGLSHLIFLEGTMNDFAYGQALLFFKEDIDEFKDKYGVKLIFEQDGAAVHRTRANITLLNKIFTKNGWIQNAPNSPDLAYPIENLWGILKPRVKQRNPQTIQELKKILLEEWSSVPIELIHNLCKGYLERVQKVLELKGARLEPEHMKKAPSEILYQWQKPESLPNMRVVYNNKKIYKYKKKEMRIIKGELKKLKALNIPRLNNKPFENINSKFTEYFVLLKETIDNDGIEEAELKKEEYIRSIKDMLESIQEMNLVEYLEHLKEISQDSNNNKNELKDQLNEQDTSEASNLQNQSNMDDQIDNIIVEQKIMDLMYMKNIDKHIRYKIRF